MLVKELYGLVKQGFKPTIQFTDYIGEYVEESVGVDMRCKLINATKEYDASIKFEIDLNGFEEYNKSVAKPSCYEENGMEKLTWFETCMYPENGIEAIYLPFDIKIPFIIIEEN